MKYEICSKRDFDNGMVMTVRFPKSDLEEKSLYTILNDTPEFLVPLNFKIIDDTIECIYHVGNLMKAKLFFGTKDKESSIAQWNMIFKPLTECKDWFLIPTAFAFDVDFLFSDKNQGGIKYIYVPVRSEQSTYDDLKSMVKEISVQNPVEDAVFENTVLKAFMGDFTPSTFLAAINKHSDASKQSVTKPTVEKPKKQVGGFVSPQPAAPVQRSSLSETPAQNPSNVEPQVKKDVQPVNSGVISKKPAPQSLNDDIIINMEGTTSAPPMPKDKKKKEKTKSKGLFGSKSKKTTADQSKMYGSAAELYANPEPSDPHVVPTQSKNLPPVEEYVEQPDDSVTRIDSLGNVGPYLSYIGNKPNMPQRIEVKISVYGRFSIGRFDVVLNKRQSDFEFEGPTKGVSRRHAIIEQSGESYTITDLQSAAGTFVNGVKLGVNETVKLSDGARVSFGYDGADYVWKE